jgi:nucleoside-diphosphate-sugar epimerase
MAKKILIYGNLGYVGSTLSKYFKEINPEIYLCGVDAGYFQGCFLDPLKSSDFFIDIQYNLDVRGSAHNQEFLSKFDTIIYLAAISNDPMGKAFERQTNEINTQSAVKIATTAKLAGVKNFIFASSCSIYGSGGEDLKNEKSYLDPLTTYAVSKINCENLLKEISDYKFNITCLRFATACGLSPRLRLDLVLNDFVMSALVNNKIEILSDGTSLRPLIDVSDMCRAIDWATQRQALYQDNNFISVNVGSNEWNFKILDLAKEVQKLIPTSEITVNEKSFIDPRSYKVDFTLFKQLAPSFIPVKKIEETIQELINSILESGFSNRNFRQSHLIRLNVLKMLVEKNILDENLYYQHK